jgi:hypothetical protein
MSSIWWKSRKLVIIRRELLTNGCARLAAGAGGWRDGEEWQE